MNPPTTFTQYEQEVATLAGIPSVQIVQATEDGQDVVVLANLDMKTVVGRLVIMDSRLRYDVDLVNAEAMHWARMAAAARRCWAIRERQYRIWKAEKEFSLRTAVEPGKGWGQGGKVNGEQVEAHYRTAPGYGAVCAAVEAAEETCAVLEAIHQLFRAKAELLKADVRRVPDGSLQRLSV